MGQDEIKNFVQMKNEDFQRKKERRKVLEEISSKNIFFFFLAVTVKCWTELWIELAKNKKKLEQTPLLTWLDGQDRGQSPRNGQLGLEDLVAQRLLQTGNTDENEDEKLNKEFELKKNFFFYFN